MSAQPKGKGQRPAMRGQPMNLPPQVFTKMHQEESLLKEHLAVLQRNMYYSIMDTVHKQQVAGRRLATLERRIRKDRERVVQIRRTMSAPPGEGPLPGLRRAAAGPSDLRWGRPAPRPPTSATYGCDRRWSTVEYFRKLLQPSVLVSRGRDAGSGDVQWAMQVEEGGGGRDSTTTSPVCRSASVHGKESRCFTPSQWVSVNSPSQLEEESEGLGGTPSAEDPTDIAITSVMPDRARSSKHARRKH